MDALKNILLIAGLLPPVIFTVMAVHELGHYWAARLLRVRIGSFVIGFGKILWKRTDGSGVEWVVRSFPVTGHVHLAGGNECPAWAGGTRLYEDSPLAVRMTVVAAGPLVNILLPFVMLFLALAVTGQPVRPALINGVETGEAAHEAGILPGDRVSSINGVAVRDYQQVKEITMKLPPRPVFLEMERDGRLIPLTITPSVIEYVDTHGMEKRHGRLGVMVRHRPYSLEALETVGGTDVKDNPDLAREKLLEHMGERVELGLDSVDGKRHYYSVDLNETTNAHLRDPSHRHYDNFFAGSITDNVYMRLSAPELLRETLSQSLRVIGNVFSIPLQVFPLDSDDIAPETLVSTETSFAKHGFFRFCYMASLISVFIAMVNLVPFPGLDGEKLLLGGVEAVAGAGFAHRHRAMILVWALAVLYLCVLSVNIPDLSVYLGKKIEQASEFIAEKV